MRERSDKDYLGVLMKWMCCLTLALLVLFFLYQTSRNRLDLIDASKEQLEDVKQKGSIHYP